MSGRHGLIHEPVKVRNGGSTRHMKELRHWLALVRTTGLGWATLDAMLAEYGTPEALFTLKSRDFKSFALAEPVVEQLQHPDWQRIDADLEWMQQSRAELVTAQDARYPALLKTIPTPPIALFARGNAELLTDHQLAIVGSRNPTRAGREIARDFSRTLATSGLVITSGLAMGIDAEAHAGALSAPNGATIAVVGTGLDRLYPAKNRDIAERIIAEGLMISEFPPGTPPKAENFPRRNRIISGLSLGTLVVEAAWRSGSLITARLASEQGREIFAIPGSIHNPLARGCHRLIREGAKLVESAQDVLEELAPLVNIRFDMPKTRPSTLDQKEEDPEYEQLLQIVGYDPTSVDVIVEQTGLTADVISSMLLILELQGKVEAAPGGRYSRVTEGSRK